MAMRIFFSAPALLSIGVLCNCTSCTFINNIAWPMMA